MIPRNAILRTSAVLATLLLSGEVSDSARFALPPLPPLPVPGHASKDTLFTDDFSGGMSRWTPDQPGVWSVRSGMLRADLPDEKQQRSLIYAGDESWSDYALDFDVCAMRGVDKGGVIRVQGETGVGVDLRGGQYQDVVMYLREWPMGKATATNATTTWSHLRIEAKGPRYRVFVNGEKRLDRADIRRGQGRIALAAYTGGIGQCTVWYDNVRVTALK